MQNSSLKFNASEFIILNHIVVDIYPLKVSNTTKYVFSLNSWYSSYVYFIEKKNNFTVCGINDVGHNFST